MFVTNLLHLSALTCLQRGLPHPLARSMLLCGRCHSLLVIYLQMQGDPCTSPVRILCNTPRSCILATLSSNMDLTLWTAAKNCLKGEWTKVRSTATALLVSCSYDVID